MCFSQLYIQRWIKVSKQKTHISSTRVTEIWMSTTVECTTTVAGDPRTRRAISAYDGGRGADMRRKFGTPTLSRGAGWAHLTQPRRLHLPMTCPLLLLVAWAGLAPTSCIHFGARHLLLLLLRRQPRLHRRSRKGKNYVPV